MKTADLLKRSLVLVLILSCLFISSSGGVFAAPLAAKGPTVSLLVSDLQSGSGSTVGPDGALYVTEGVTGKVLRVDRQTGQVSTFASGLPKILPDVGIGGTMDVAFIKQTAYVLVTLVGSDWGGSDTVGIYRVDGPQSFTVIADIGQWSIDHEPPPTTSYDTPTGVQYAMQPYQGGFLVNDSHHNRLLKVGLDGQIEQLFQFGDDVNTGLALRLETIYIAEAGPIPHLPENGKIVSFVEGSTSVKQLAAGAPLLVDVEFGPGNRLYGLAQGIWHGAFEGAPADPDTGSLVRANDDGTFTTIVSGLNQPTSLEIIGNTAYVVGLNGDIWKITHVSDDPVNLIASQGGSAKLPKTMDASSSSTLKCVNTLSGAVASLYACPNPSQIPLPEWLIMGGGAPNQ